MHYRTLYSQYHIVREKSVCVCVFFLLFLGHSQSLGGGGGGLALARTLSVDTIKTLKRSHISYL